MSRIAIPSPAKNEPTSGGSGAAALETTDASPRPSSERIGPSTAWSARANSSAKAAGVLWPNCLLSMYRRPTSMA